MKENGHELIIYLVQLCYLFFFFPSTNRNNFIKLERATSREKNEDELILVHPQKHENRKTYKKASNKRFGCYNTSNPIVSPWLVFSDDPTEKLQWAHTRSMLVLHSRNLEIHNLNTVPRPCYQIKNQRVYTTVLVSKYI